MPSPGLLHDKGWLLPDKGGLLNDKGWLLRILLFLVGLLADSRPTTEPLYIVGGSVVRQKSFRIQQSLRSSKKDKKSCNFLRMSDK